MSCGAINGVIWSDLGELMRRSVLERYLVVCCLCVGMVQRLETSDSPRFKVDARYEARQHELQVRFTGRSFTYTGYLSEFPESGDEVKLGLLDIWLKVVEMDTDLEHIREYAVTEFAVDSDEFSVDLGTGISRLGVSIDEYR